MRQIWAGQNGAGRGGYGVVGGGRGGGRAEGRAGGQTGSQKHSEARQ